MDVGRIPVRLDSTGGGPTATNQSGGHKDGNELALPVIVGLIVGRGILDAILAICSILKK